MNLMIVTEENRAMEKPFSMIANQCGLSVSSVRPYEAVAKVSQEKPDFVLVNCDIKDGARTIEKLESLELNTKVFGFGFSRQPTNVQNYLRLPFLIGEFASALNLQVNKGEVK